MAITLRVHPRENQSNPSKYLSCLSPRVERVYLAKEPEDLTWKSKRKQVRNHMENKKKSFLLLGHSSDIVQHGKEIKPLDSPPPPPFFDVSDFYRCSRDQIVKCMIATARSSALSSGRENQKIPETKKKFDALVAMRCPLSAVPLDRRHFKIRISRSFFPS